MLIWVVRLHLSRQKYLSSALSCRLLYFMRSRAKFNIQGVVSGRLNTGIQKLYIHAFDKGWFSDSFLMEWKMEELQLCSWKKAPLKSWQRPLTCWSHKQLSQNHRIIFLHASDASFHLNWRQKNNIKRLADLPNPYAYLGQINGLSFQNKFSSEGRRWDFQWDFFSDFLGKVTFWS